MSEFILTRKDVEDQIRKFVHLKDHNLVKQNMEKWMIDRQCSPFEVKQIMNDLPSYPDYLGLVN